MSGLWPSTCPPSHRRYKELDDRQNPRRREADRAGDGGPVRADFGAQAASRTGLPRLSRHRPARRLLWRRAVEAAAERAIAIGARTYASVKSILDNRLDRRPAEKRAAEAPRAAAFPRSCPNPSGTLYIRSPQNRLWRPGGRWRPDSWRFPSLDDGHRIKSKLTLGNDAAIPALVGSANTRRYSGSWWLVDLDSNQD
jgi:hypothetical protein